MRREISHRMRHLGQRGAKVVSGHPTLTIIVFFAFLSALSILPYAVTGYFYVHSDGTFHLSRIQELAENLKQFNLFPGVATHMFNQIGSSVMACYPYLIPYPFALLLLVLKPVGALYVGLMLIVFATLGIAYWSMRLIGASRLVGLYFSLLYGFTVYIFIEMMYLNHYGEI